MMTPRREHFRYLRDDPRPILITSNPNLGVSGKGFGKIPNPDDPDPTCEGGKLVIDFVALKTEKERQKHKGRPEVVVAHELGHIFTAFRNPRKFLNLFAADRQGPLYKGYPMSEIQTIINYEDPMRKYLKVPPVFTDSDIQAIRQKLR
ncbi:MAG: hypothetical protein HY319_15810 [Armatimonadetes bacterium]|nr:hypothetical protein [Armatimonadota bacterium]